MENSDDMELLREYAARDSQPAFETLVHRHVNLVYSAALRQVRDPVLAGEVTQTVFIILSRKARTLGQATILSGWLYRTAQLAAGRVLRTESRRRKYEQEAAQMEPEQSDSTWARIAPFLDEAMARLGDTDRNAVVLRFFENKNLREVGNALGTNERAAQKRVARAVEKLRVFFTKRGVVVPAVLVTTALSANAVVAAPAGIASNVIAVATVQGGIVSASTLTLIKGTLKLMAWTKAKTAIAVSIGVLVSVGTTAITVKEIQEHRTYPWQDMVDGGTRAEKALNTTPPQVRIVPSKFTADKPHGRLSDDIRSPNVRILRTTNPPPSRLFDNIGSPSRWRFIAVHASPNEIVRAPFVGYNPNVNVELSCYVVFPSDMPGGFYDYIANLPNGSREALQALVKKKFGLIGKYETRDMDVLLLKLDHPDAPGLKPETPLRPGQPWPLPRVTDGKIHYKNWPISNLAKVLETVLQIPVVDQTGLTGNYDLDLPEKYGATPAEKIEKARQVLHGEFGLKLVPGREPIEMLVVETVLN